MHSSSRVTISRGFAAVGVLLFISATASPAEWYPAAQFLVGIACLAISHALTPCEDDLTPWWKAQLTKLLHRHWRLGVARTLQIKVKPNSRASALEQAADGTWVARVKAPPVDGKANAELVELVAAHFGCRKSAVAIRSGASGRVKLVQIEAG